MADVKTISGVTVDVPVHAANLAAHTLNIGQILQIGAYTSLDFVGAYNAAAISANRLHAVQAWVSRDITIDRIAIHITVAGAAGKVVRLGIHNDGTNCLPGALLKDCGTVPADATGVQAITLSPAVALAKGYYWLDIFSDGAPTLVGFQPVIARGGQHPTDFAYLYTHWYKELAYGALPDPFPADATHFAFTYRVFVRVASLA